MSLGSNQQQSAVPAVAAMETDKYPYNLGSYQMPITTVHPDTQQWFDRGVNWMYGFNHEEAARCFQRAHELDPTCAMALWGLASTSGPHYNFGWDSQSPAMRTVMTKRTHDFVVRAREAQDASKGTARPTTATEDALIEAVQARFPQSDAPSKLEEYAAWNESYADAMQRAYEAFPQDLDVGCLYAESMLNLTPWKLWDVWTGKPLPAPARTLSIKSVLEKLLEEQRTEALRHPGVLHMYIHLMETSHQPEAAVPASNALRNLVPGSGHLQHMASHIDVLVGTYREGAQSNADAVAVDRVYLQLQGKMGMYTLYSMHNVTSLIFAAMMAGNIQQSLEGCDSLEELMDEAFLRVEDPPWADFAESAVSTRHHVLVRFGKWHDILALPLPDDAELYTVTIATAHYARCVAHAALGDVEASARERDLFVSAVARVQETRKHFPNNSREVLGVARAMADGELEYRRGNFDAAFAHLAEAVRLDDALMYGEPPSWMVPARHAAAALLLEQGHVDRAAAYYAEDLGLDFAAHGGTQAALARARQHPINPWALRGYHDCLVRLGRPDEAKKIEEQLVAATVGADVDIKASCFCARGTSGTINGTGTKDNCC